MSRIKFLATVCSKDEILAKEDRFEIFLFITSSVRVEFLQFKKLVPREKALSS